MTLQNAVKQNGRKMHIQIAESAVVLARSESLNLANAIGIYGPRRFPFPKWLGKKTDCLNPDKTFEDSGETGFTLVEMLIALSILAISFTVLFQSISTAIERVHRTKTQDTAIEIARSLFDQIGIIWPLSEGTLASGERDGLSWTVTAAPYLGTSGGGPDDPEFLQITVELRQTPSSRRVVRLTSLRFAGSGER